MKRLAFVVALSGLVLAVSACATHQSRGSADEAAQAGAFKELPPDAQSSLLAAMEDIPDSSFASVRFCNSMLNVNAGEMTAGDLADYFGGGLSDIQANDPVSMTSALQGTLAAARDSIQNGFAGYETAITNLISECTTVLSGERGMG